MRSWAEPCQSQSVSQSVISRSHPALTPPASTGSQSGSAAPVQTGVQTSTEYSLPGATQLSLVRSFSTMPESPVKYQSKRQSVSLSVISRSSPRFTPSTTGSRSGSAAAGPRHFTTISRSALSVSQTYFTVPPRAHPSAGSSSGSAAPVLTQVPSTRSRGLLKIIAPGVSTAPLLGR